MKRVLQNKLFMASFVADMLSNFGDVVYYLALMNYVLLLPEAKLAISLVTISESLPFLTMIFMGIWGDKTRNKVDTILATLFFRVGLYLLVGIAMGFQPALWVVILATLVNLLSDLAGQYENALYTPLSLRVVAADDRETMYAFRQGASSILKILFQSSGALLIGLMTYQALAFFNAGTFLICAFIMLAIRPSLKKLLTDQPIKQSQTEQEEQASHFLRQTWSSISQSYQAVQSISVLKASILTIAGLNAVFAAEDALILLTIKENSRFALVNPATTLALLAIITLLGNVLGSVLLMSLCKKVSFGLLLKISAIMPVLLFLGFLFQNIYAVLLVNFLTMIVVGILNPKMQAFVISALPEDRLATISAGIESFCTLGLVLCRLVLSSLLLFLTGRQIALAFLLLSLALLVYALQSSRQKKTEQS